MNDIQTLMKRVEQCMDNVAIIAHAVSSSTNRVPTGEIPEAIADLIKHIEGLSAVDQARIAKALCIYAQDYVQGQVWQKVLQAMKNKDRQVADLERQLETQQAPVVAAQMLAKTLGATSALSQFIEKAMGGTPEQLMTAGPDRAAHHYKIQVNILDLMEMPGSGYEQVAAVVRGEWIEHDQKAKR